MNLTQDALIRTFAHLNASYANRDRAELWQMHPVIYARLSWLVDRPQMRKLYRAAGFPFGRNQAAFKRWVQAGGFIPELADANAVPSQ